MTDIYLRASDQATIDAVLASADLIDSDGHPASEMVCIDRIGTIWNVTGYDGDGNPVIETEEGWHCNLRLLFDPSQAQVDALATVTIATPETPFRVWA